MNGIRATYDFTKNQWLIETENLLPENNELMFVFVSDTEYTDLTDYRFGFRLEDESGILKSGKFPAEGVTKFQIARTPYFADTLSFEIEKKYDLLVYLIGPGGSIESKLNIVGPRPRQPYPSWTWANGQWNSPKEKPPGPYQWDETKQEWLPTEKNFPYPTK